MSVCVCKCTMSMHAAIIYVLCRHKKCVQKLLEAGADIRLQDYDGQTAVKQCIFCLST